MSDPFTPVVCDVLDIFFADRDDPAYGPDFEAIRTRLFASGESLYTVAVDLLRVMHLVYEDEAAARTVLFREKHGL
jgi:hypothetical protein